MFVARMLKDPNGIVDVEVWSAALAHLRTHASWHQWKAPGTAAGQLCNTESRFSSDNTRALAILGSPHSATNNQEPTATWSEDSTRLLPSDIREWEGLFSVIGIDSAKHTLVAMTDRTGMWPVYYSEDDTGLWVSSSSIAIGCLRAVSFDHDALACLQAAGYLLDDRTLFREVKRLDEGTELTYSDGRLSIERWWQPQMPKQSSTVRAEAEAFVESAISNLNKRLGDSPKILCTLTAGLDSRCILSLVRKAKLRATYFTSITGAPIEVTLARVLTEKLGLDWFEFTPPQLDIDRYREITSMSTLLCDGSNHPFRGTTYWAAALAEQNAPTVWGIGGEVWRDYWSKQEKAKLILKGSTPLERLIRHRMAGTPFPPGMLAEDHAGNARARAMEILTPPFERFSDRSTLDRLEAMYLTQRIRIWASVHLNSVAWWTPAEVPFLGQKLIEHAYALPFSVRKGGELLRHVIWRLDPEAGRIPHNDGYYTAPSSKATWLQKLNASKLDAIQLLRKLRLMKRPPQAVPRKVALPTYREAFEPQLQPENMSSAFLYKAEALKQQINDSWHRRAGDVPLLNTILGLEFALAATSRLET